MPNNSSRMPLHLQNPALIKATGAQVNPSWESFRPHHTHNINYETQKWPDRPNTHAMSVMRRYADGKLDLQWAKNMVLDAIKGSSFEGGGAERPVQMALATLILPEKIREVEPRQAEIMTQMSATEKQQVRTLVLAQLAEEENWNAGVGGDSVEGRSKTRDGMP